MEDRRHGNRWNLLLFLPIWDEDENSVMGYIADITDDGILLFSKDHIELGRKFSLSIHMEDLTEAFLAKDISGERISFQAQSRWVDFDVKPAFHRTGLKFINLTPEQAEAVKQLVQNVSDNLVFIV
ncbi:MAG: PilZ domain-containing protein [Gammaproteobacteria bacterium]|nr:PilZ domain-containing protein [Gammaproteobacteria bacterium]